MKLWYHICVERYVRTSHTGLYFICLWVYHFLKNLVWLVGGFHIFRFKCICINMPLSNQDIEVIWAMKHNMMYIQYSMCLVSAIFPCLPQKFWIFIEKRYSTRYSAMFPTHNMRVIAKVNPYFVSRN